MEFDQDSYSFYLSFDPITHNTYIFQVKWKTKLKNVILNHLKCVKKLIENIVYCIENYLDLYSL